MIDMAIDTRAIDTYICKLECYIGYKRMRKNLIHKGESITENEEKRALCQWCIAVFFFITVIICRILNQNASSNLAPILSHDRLPLDSSERWFLLLDLSMGEVERLYGLFPIILNGPLITSAYQYGFSLFIFAFFLVFPAPRHFFLRRYLPKNDNLGREQFRFIALFSLVFLFYITFMFVWLQSLPTILFPFLRNNVRTQLIPFQSNITS